MTSTTHGCSRFGAVLLGSLVTSAGLAEARQAARRRASPRSPRMWRPSSTSTARTATGRARSRRCRFYLQGGAPVGPGHPRQRHQRRDAAVACRSGARQVVNDRRLSAAEKDTIVRWVTAGAPEGNARDLPEAARYAQGWTMGQPDAIVTMEQGIRGSRAGRDSLSVLRDADELHGGQVGSGVRGAAAATARSCTTCSSTRAAPGTTRPPQAFRTQNPPGPMSPTQAKEMEEAKTNPAVAQAMREQRQRRGLLIAQIAPGTPPAIFAPGTAMRLPAGHGADVPDPLHDQRQGRHRSEQHRLQVCEAAAGATKCAPPRWRTRAS